MAVPPRSSTPWAAPSFKRVRTSRSEDHLWLDSARSSAISARCLERTQAKLNSDSGDGGEKVKERLGRDHLDHAGREGPGQKRSGGDRQEELPEHVPRPKDPKYGLLAALGQVTQRHESRLQHIEGVRRGSGREDGAPLGEAPFGADFRYLVVLLRGEPLPQLDGRGHHQHI